MKKSAAIGIAAAVIIAAIVAIYVVLPAKNSPTLPSQEGTPANSTQVSGAAPSVPSQNATGRHLSVTIDEQVGIKSK